MDRRRRLGAIAGALAAIAGGMSGLLGQHRADADTGHRYWLIGLSVGISVGIAILLLAKMKGSGGD